MQFHGMIAGLLNRFGKIGVIIGFVLGNAVLTYLINGNVAEIIYLKEIIVSSIALLLIPKSIDLSIEDLIGKNKLLPNYKGRMLEETGDTVYKLNNVSETIAEIATTYKEVAATVLETDKEIYEENRNLFIDEFLNNIAELSDSILYDDITNLENGILDDIFQILTEKEEIDLQDLSHVLEKRNSYILGISDRKTNEQIEDDITEMIKAMNYTYKISKLSFAWKQKINENKKTLSEQLNGVSKVINSVAEEINAKTDNNNEKQQEEIQVLLSQKEIEITDITIKQEKNKKYVVTIYTKQEEEVSEDLKKIQKIEEILTKTLKEKMILQKQKKQKNGAQIQIYSSEDKYTLQIGIAKTTKTNSKVSGDSNLHIKLDDGKYLIALSDGMGSGEEAKKNSSMALKMLKKLLTVGFDKDVSMQLINSTLSLNSGQDMYSTLDMCILDLYKGNVEFIKNGAMPTLIKSEKSIKTVESISLPAGIMSHIDLITYDMDVQAGDIMVMCTDGIIESKTENSKWLEEMLKSISTQNVQKIADLILSEAIDNNYGTPKDDMTVIVAKIR